MHTCLSSCLLLQHYAVHLDINSFPTRRSSDLKEQSEDLFMKKLMINGGKKLSGRVTISDAKNRDRKSTRLNSSHVATSYAVFCSKKKTENEYVARIVEVDAALRRGDRYEVSVT